MIKQTRKKSYRVCFKMGENYYRLIGRFRSKQLAISSDNLQNYFIKKYGRPGPAYQHCKTAYREFYRG